MTVSSLDSGTVKDEEDQQQTEAAFQRGAGVLNCVIQHAGLVYAGVRIVHNFLVKISIRSA